MAAERGNDRRARGTGIEALARDFLVGEGLSPIAANANYRFGELDLVMRDRHVVVFVEVRYRRNVGNASAGFGDGAESINRAKRSKLVRAAELFLATHREYANAACRFDVIDASGSPQSPTFRWLRDAFRADDV